MPVKLQMTSSACTPSPPGLQPPISVVDIQGTWREAKTTTVWKVDGIVAQKHKQRSKAVVLSDSPNGVEWGTGNLMGSIEDALLVWRNRTGQVMYTWERPGPESLDSQPSQAMSAQEPTIHAALQVKDKCGKEPAKAVVSEKAEEPAAHLSSPRSTSSTVSTAPTDSAGGMAHSAISIGGDVRVPVMKVDNKPTKQTAQEVAKLLEMAGSRLASGDYATAMQYVLFAQTLDPPAVK
jgi:hypothetical protein